MYRVHDHRQTQADRVRLQLIHHIYKTYIYIYIYIYIHTNTPKEILPLTHSYTPQRAHSHQQHSPTQATIQEFLVFIRHPEPKLKRCHPKPQLKLAIPVFWDGHATRVEFIRFGCFLCSWRFLIRKKSCSNLYEWLDIVFHWKFVELGFNWDENCMKVILGLMN